MFAIDEVFVDLPKPTKSERPGCGSIQIVEALAAFARPVNQESRRDFSRVDGFTQSGP